ncbi:MAG: hypothetical protein AABX38_01530 [Candidatus Micrarchaeota archaeon]
MGLTKFLFYLYVRGKPRNELNEMIKKSKPESETTCPFHQAVYKELKRQDLRKEKEELMKK